jgi:hypothetical protein
LGPVVVVVVVVGGGGGGGGGGGESNSSCGCCRAKSCTTVPFARVTFGSYAGSLVSL